MAERIPQSVSYLVVFRAYLASDGKTPATGKTIAITVSKNGGAFGNPNAGATNATEISSGFYKFTLDATDTGTLGPLAWRGAEGTINDAGDVLSVANPNNAGFAALPDAAADAAGGLPVSDAGGLDLDTLLGRLDVAVSTRLVGTTTGSGFTAIPWNAAWDAEVQSECADALTAYGASTLTGAAAADAVWDETLADHLGAGSTGNALNAAGSAGDPWSTALPGAYGAGTAGKILGDNLNAAVGSRASQTTADAIEADTQDIQSRLPAALTASGNMKADALAISGDTTAADNAEKYFDGTGYGEILVRTTISAIGSQTNFGLTDGSDDNDAYNGCLLVVEDQATAAQKGVCHILDYQTTLRQVTLAEAPPFTVVAGDIVTVLARRSLAPTVRGLTLDVTTGGNAGIDWGNIANQSSAPSLNGSLQRVNLVTSIDAAGITANSIEANAIGASELATDAVDEIAAAVWAAVTRTLTSAANITSTGGTTVPQTGDSFARIGATGSGLTSLAQASVCTEARLAELDAANLPATTDAVLADTAEIGAAGAGLTALGDTRMANLDATVSSRSTLAAGAAMTLTSGERDAVAAALLDLAAGVETGVTPRQALRGIAAILAGIVSGAGTGTEVFKGIGQASGGTTRVTVTVDGSGNRSAIVLNL